MAEKAFPDPIVIAFEVDDPDLADRLAALLAALPGLRLAAPGEAADATLIAPAIAAASGWTGAPNAAEGALTARELEVLALLAEGASNKTIARRLEISVHTAKFHVGRLIDKLDATGRTDAVTHAARIGVINL